MRMKKETIVLVCVIVLLGAYVLLRNTDRAHYKLPVLPQMLSRDITKIEIQLPDESMLLENKNGKWIILPEGYRADPATAASMLNAAESLTFTALVSESKSYERYDLDSKKKIAVKLWSKDRLVRAFEIGKTAETFRHTHVRLSDDPGVYLVLGNLRTAFDRKKESLRDSTVLFFDKERIEEIHIVGQDKQPMVLRRQISEQGEADPPPGGPASSVSETAREWRGADGKKIDGSAVDRLLTFLSIIKCDSYVNEKPEPGTPVYSFTFKGPETYRLSIYEKTEKQARQYPAASSQAETPFMLSESTIKGFEPQVKSLFAR